MKHPRDTYAAYQAEYDAEELRQKEVLRRYLERRNPTLGEIEIPPLNVLTTAVIMIVLAGVILYIGWWLR